MVIVRSPIVSVIDSRCCDRCSSPRIITSPTSSNSNAPPSTCAWDCRVRDATCSCCPPREQFELLHAPDLQSGLGISVREAQVLTCLAEGHTSSEVAAELGISVRTVHKHLENLYRCIGVSSQREAVTIARGLAE
ncbi:MAG: hypothetical protein B7Z74_11195 [Deltaproteobacteria bacterium 21-66-5]|nr:MAG: hypothetical protein B7Z74_11195 [Deltaproteobacteria bacterium 21-66-5]